jgi:hypothetical protein
MTSSLPELRGRVKTLMFAFRLRPPICFQFVVLPV